VYVGSPRACMQDASARFFRRRKKGSEEFSNFYFFSFFSKGGFPVSRSLAEDTARACRPAKRGIYLWLVNCSCAHLYTHIGRRKPEKKFVKVLSAHPSRGAHTSCSKKDTELSSRISKNG
jgi:hypothetical protein